MKKSSQTYTYHYNSHGDVIALSNSQGIKVASYTYDSWGNILEVQEDTEIKDNPFKYSGYYYDEEINAYYLLARYYNPKHGVFISSDPDPGDDDDILTQNGYSYANNNPVMKVDPDGRVAWWVAAALGGAVFDGGRYAWKNRKHYKKKRFWKGLGKSAGYGAVKGVAFGAAGKAVYWASKGGRWTKVGKIGDHYGVRWKTRKGSGYTHKSFEYHSPHNGHGYH